MLFKRKDFYHKLIEIKIGKVQFSKAKATYMTSYKLETNYMEKYYLLPRKVTNNNQLREFQFKILHRQTP